MKFNGFELTECTDLVVDKDMLVWNDGDLAVLNARVVGKLKGKIIAYSCFRKDEGEFLTFDHCAKYPELKIETRPMTPGEVYMKFISQGSSALVIGTKIEEFCLDPSVPACMFSVLTQEWVTIPYLAAAGYRFIDGTPLEVDIGCSWQNYKDLG